MGEIVAKTAVAIEAMSESERTMLFDYLRKSGTHVCGPLEGSLVEEEAPAKKTRGGKRRSFWMKTVTGFDESKKKGFRLEGEWVNKGSDVSRGTAICLCATRADDTKRYYVLTAEPGMSFAFDTLSGRKEAEGMKLCAGPFDRWEDFEKAAKELIGI